MKILAIDTTGSVCSAAVMQDGKLLCEQYLDYQLTHSVKLMPMVESCLGAVNMELAEIDLFASVVGPGSFTGVRIGVTTVKGFMHATGKKAVAVNTLDCLAENISGFDGLICPMLDARRGEVYAAGYEGGVKIIKDQAIPLAALLEQIGGKKVLFLGDGAIALECEIKRAMPSAQFAPAHLMLQRASSAVLIASRTDERSWKDAFELEPYYLRQSQAERNDKGK